MTRQRFLAAALALFAAPLLFAQKAFAALAPGTIQLSRIEDGRRIWWKTFGTTAIIQGADGSLEVTYDATKRRWYLAMFAADGAAPVATPTLRMSWGGASNQAWIEAREVN